MEGAWRGFWKTARAASSRFQSNVYLGEELTGLEIYSGRKQQKSRRLPTRSQRSVVLRLTN